MYKSVKWNLQCNYRNSVTPMTLYNVNDAWIKVTKTMLKISTCTQTWHARVVKSLYISWNVFNCLKARVSNTRVTVTAASPYRMRVSVNAKGDFWRYGSLQQHDDSV